MYTRSCDRIIAYRQASCETLDSKLRDQIADNPCLHKCRRNQPDFVGQLKSYCHSKKIHHERQLDSLP